MVDFYDKMQSSGTNFLLPLTPFDTIIGVTDYTYLFPPLLGTKRYAACAPALLSLLVYIIPSFLSNTLNVLVNTVRSESGNGYDLLYRALKVFDLALISHGLSHYLIGWTELQSMITQQVWYYTSASRHYTKCHIATTTRASRSSVALQDRNIRSSPTPLYLRLKIST